MTVRVDEQTPETILKRVDAIVDELLTLRQDLQSMVRKQETVNIVEELSGALGPAPVDELEYFQSLEIDWKRFER